MGAPLHPENKWLKTLDSTANPHVKRAASFYDRKIRNEVGVFLVDGERLFRDGLESRHGFESVFLLEKHLSKYHEDLMSLAQRGTQVFLVNDKIMGKLSATKSPQGIFAVAKMKESSIPSMASLVLVLDGVSDPGNAGTLLRSAEAAGAGGVVFTTSSVDPYHEKVVRSAMGTHFRLPVWRDASMEEFKVRFSSHRLYVADLSGARSYDQVDWQESSALIIGGEANGASLEAKQSSEGIFIPMAGNTESLNAGVAGAVILFEAARQRRL
jgi:TrmH family RNA methyltransferase